MHKNYIGYPRVLFLIENLLEAEGTQRRLNPKLK